jgi:hypothetical protein
LQTEADVKPRPKLLMKPFHSSTLAADLQAPPLHARIWSAVKRAFAHIGPYRAAYRDAQVAAALYRDLSKLSDAELERRGIARGDVHRHVSGTFFKDTRDARTE